MCSIPFSQFKHPDIAFENETHTIVCVYTYIYCSTVENVQNNEEKSLLCLGFSFFCSLPP